MRDPDTPETLAPVLVHVPHASILIPDKIKSSILLSDEELWDELLRMTDRYTDELFALPRELASAVEYPISRLVVDSERFPDDDREPMSGRGMGVIYERTSRNTPLRHRPAAGEREELLATYYRPHHDRLAAEVGRILERHGLCLIIDGHSFATVPLPHESDQVPHRPDVCIGTDPFHTPAALADLAMEAFRRQGFSVECDRPFRGSLVPDPYYQSDRRVSSVMVEVRRGVYMDEGLGGKLPTFGSSRSRVEAALGILIGGWVLMG